MISLLQNPALILILGGLLMLLVNNKLRITISLFTPIAAMLVFFSMPGELNTSYELFGYLLNPVRLDSLSWIFTLIFILASFIVGLYSMHTHNRMEQVSVYLYAGSALGAVLAGDLLTLFVFWEISALTSTLIIWSSSNPKAYQAGMRYLLMHIMSGLLLMVGSILHYQETQSLSFSLMALDSLAQVLIFAAFAIKCAFPLLHNWLHDSYPKASATGTVALSAYTTKLAVYCFARGFAGSEELIWIGATMAVFPIFYAVLENDLRRVLTYSLNSQLGFMIVGVGIGSELALNGTAAHAFCSVLYKALLLMSMGAVLHRIGTTKASDLGGLYKSMPWTTLFCIIGAASISSVPLFSGFVSKGIILYAVAEEHLWGIWIVLLFASVGVINHSAIKVPFASFFAHDQGLRCKEAPINMLLAMGLTAGLCILVGVAPDLLYAWLPYEMDFNAYTLDHIVGQFQLLFFAGLAFIILFRNGLYPIETPSIILDTDWIYRKLGKNILALFNNLLARFLASIQTLKLNISEKIHSTLYITNGPKSTLAHGVSTGNMVVWVAILLFACLVFYYL
jgi:multicomponent Na+:H+ antiporter subunit D